MFGLDERLAELADSGGLFVVLLLAVLLGLRHATDPDHLTAVSALVLSDERRAGRRATVLGLSWGLGHATTLIGFGLPIVLFGRYLPASEARHAQGAHQHRHAEALGRSPRVAYAIGLVHGVGGSAGVGVLLIGALSDRGHALAALLVFALGTAVSMAAVSSVFGHVVGGRAAGRMETLTPSLGVLSLAFGVWYTLGAVGAMPYLL